MVRLFIITVIGFVMLCSIHIQAATIHVTIEPEVILADEPFKIQFVAEGKLSGQPNFDVLSEHFDVSGVEQGQTLSFGLRTEQRYIWSLIVLAKKTGRMTIPAIAFGSDMSPSKDIIIKQVAANSTTEGAWIDVETDRTESYVQAQVLYTVNIYLTGQYAKTQIDDLSFTGDDVVIEPISKDFVELGKITKNGVQYQHFQRKYALFPQTSGVLTIPPIRFKGSQVVGYQRSRSFFESLRPKTVTKRIQSKPIELTILPTPERMKGKPWIPAKQLQVVETWSQDPPQFRVGESVTRTIAIAANGLTSAQIPALPIAQISGMRFYPDQAETQNQIVEASIVGVRQEKIAYVPSVSGVYVIPEIVIPWWNTQMNRYEQATIASRKVTVLPGVISQETREPVQEDKTKEAIVAPLTTEVVSEGSQPVVWVVGLLWLCTLIGWWLHWKTWGKRVQTTDASNLSEKASLKRLKKSCESQDPKVIYQALLRWGHISRSGPFRLDRFCAQLSDPGREEIKLLQAALYQKNPGQWKRGEQLYQTIVASQQRSCAQTSSDFEGLYQH